MADSDTPTRSYMDDPNIKWKTGKPVYTSVNRLYLNERTRKHKADSMEKFVENFVKTFEMETTHKIEIKDWKTIDPDTFYLCINGGWKATALDFLNSGSYNVFMNSAPLYDSDSLTNTESWELFTTAFASGFAWELLDLLSGPPVVVFTWRHWAHWTGPFLGREPTGETITLFGSAVVRLTDEQKIESVDIYYDPNGLMAKMLKFNIHDWPGCPFSKKKQVSRL